jgi:hypothetical protein
LIFFHLFILSFLPLSLRSSCNHPKRNTFTAAAENIAVIPFLQDILAKDKDAGVNGLVEYSIVKGDNAEHQDDDRIHSEDGYGYFAINLPHQGQVTVNRTLDFEKTQRYYVTVVATVSISVLLETEAAGFSSVIGFFNSIRDFALDGTSL